ncbi:MULTISPECIES: metal ABC transporter permease [Halobacteriovorax]|uniref:Metal ABC transporter permease n=1 Tax=Halobacteriovorax vibrionivorans TaxID=2152716 RepID=A0ABY0IEV5_9BACT|nr:MULTISPECIES: metal ABC transporter permease [Halobacteriovorax]RZF21482.1 metal ABC transporter permease [Halobacteriovorax vibrionivorans]TGD48754.1 metal ABC transporter permease [Halobacteriovorax sp. Y22]
MEIISFLAAPFVMCLILVGIHCYLGLHVLKRGVIFVDLSLAQVASLGSTVALLFHLDHHSSLNYFISLGFTFVAAGYFAWAKKYEKYISQEVLIALVYAFASSAVLLVVNMMAHGAEHIKEILVGKILWVTWMDVLKTGVIYSIVALIHYIFRKQIIAASMEKSDSSSFWDFVFFSLFGVVITSSVGIAGILLVFSFLVVPALLSSNLVSSLKGQLLLGWVIGTILSFIGMTLSYVLDLPAGAIIVVVFTVLPIFVLPFILRKKIAT